MELYGSSYVVDHCICANQIELEELLYREYVTNVLGGFMENSPRYHDLITPAVEQKETADDVINRLKAKMRKL